MKECPKCHSVYDDSWGVCLNCRAPLNQTTKTRPVINDHSSASGSNILEMPINIRTVSAAIKRLFVSEPHPTHLTFARLQSGPILEEYRLRNNNPKIFLPDGSFYKKWDVSNKRLSLMATQLCAYLRIPTEKILVGYDERIGHPGLYMNRDGKDMILIKKDFAWSPYDVAAILAHELMHLYHFQSGLNLSEEETDLKTIEKGLGAVFVNGFSRRDAYLFVISQRSTSYFGYVTPSRYLERLFLYMDKNNIRKKDVWKHLRGPSRKFISEHTNYK